MNRTELVAAVSAFRQRVRDYRDLMLRSRDNVMPEIVRNGREIGEMRTELNGEFGRLERFITRFGNNPRGNDGVNPHVYPVYHNAFSPDILLRVGPSTDAVLQDLDYIAGRLNGMTDDEFASVVNPVGRANTEPLPERNYWQMTNPVWLVWVATRLVWKHKILTGGITILGLLAIDYSLAWHNVLWLKDYIAILFRGGGVSS